MNCGTSVLRLKVFETGGLKLTENATRRHLLYMKKTAKQKKKLTAPWWLDDIFAPEPFFWPLIMLPHQQTHSPLLFVCGPRTNF